MAPLNAANLLQAIELCDEMLSVIKARMPASQSQDDMIVLRYAELRYKGQHHTLRILWDSNTTSDALKQLFENTYRQRYGHVTADALIEFVSIATIVRHAVQKPNLEAMASQSVAGANSSPTSIQREVFLARSRNSKMVPVFQRAELPIGFAHPGPALIEEYGATCLIDEGDRFHIGHLAELHIDVSLT
ncbi:MAG: hypothetical protein EXR35_05375 [Limnohabitans sp.]|nr:hypothetical protein [Limnohabitans sp.]